MRTEQELDELDAGLEEMRAAQEPRTARRKRKGR